MVCEWLRRPDVEIISLGLIDSPERAMEAGHQFRRQDVDVIFLYVTTHALASTVLPVVHRAKVPVIILNLQPEAAIDYAAFSAIKHRSASPLRHRRRAHRGQICQDDGHPQMRIETVC